MPFLRNRLRHDRRCDRLRRLLARAVLLVAAAVFSTSAHAETPPGPTAAETRAAPVVGDAEIAATRLRAAAAVVDRLHDEILYCMKNAKELGYDGRYERMFVAVDETYDLPFMARASIGATWRELDVVERTEWVALSKRLSAASYANNFDGWSGETIERVATELAPRDTVRVVTNLVSPRDPDIQFDYRLRERDGRWRIIDVQLDGTVSELALRRADYTSTIERSGFDQLVLDLNAKIGAFAN